MTRIMAQQRIWTGEPIVENANMGKEEEEDAFMASSMVTIKLP